MLDWVRLVNFKSHADTTVDLGRRRIDRNAKNVIEDLEPDRARAKEQLNEGPLDTLTERGRDCGLTEFLEEVKTRLVLQLQ